MTPMIDMTFQLIAFFMVLVNFSKVDADQRITLPESRLAKPPDSPLKQPLTLQITRQGRIVIQGEEVELEGLRNRLQAQAQDIKDEGKAVGATTVIIRADAEVDTGKVQEVIKICQEVSFEKFALRAKEKEEWK